MAHSAHMAQIQGGVLAWNQWRKDHPDEIPDLSGSALTHADLRGINLTGANLRGAHLEGANLELADLQGANLVAAHLCGAESDGDGYRPKSLNRLDAQSMDLAAKSVTWSNLRQAKLARADLSGADVSGADLSGADLTHATLIGTNLTWAALNSATLPDAKLPGARLFEAHLVGADLTGARLQDADLEGAKLERTIFEGANLRGANLCRAVLLEAKIGGAVFEDCKVHGVSVWSCTGEPNSQRNLRITRSFEPYNEPELMVDELEVAQFIYLILNNPNIRKVIDTITSKAVLILGRFTPPGRKATLEALRDQLREGGVFAPILFDFEKSEARDLTETVQLLASMSCFVIVDLSDPKSVPQELMAIVPHLPSVPVQTIIDGPEDLYAMFEHFMRYPWVLKPTLRYTDTKDLLARLEGEIVLPAQGYRHRSAGDQEAARKLEEAMQRIAMLERTLKEAGQAVPSPLKGG